MGARQTARVEPGGRSAGAWINKAVRELQKRLVRQRIRISRRELRTKLTEALAAVSAAPNASIGSMLTRRFESQRLLAAAEAEVMANLAEGRSQGGLRGSEAHRKNRRERAERWWSLAGRLQGTLSQSLDHRQPGAQPRHRRSDSAPGVRRTSALSP